ncbi:MAG TPA: type I polyketide synthase, partial [Solirubrobacteraceae bacterium]|nr:type I polyketide synthase [Solirubrobacteraceae bacterium]
AQALLATYGQQRPQDRPLWLGSIKSNFGHAQAAAGVAGVIKMVMAMRHETLPRTLHVDAPSTHVDWSAGAVSLLTEPIPWARSDRPRRAGISSFGISGTNAHLIIEEAPSVARSESAGHGAFRGEDASCAQIPSSGQTPAPAQNEPSVLTTPDALPWLLSARGADVLHEQAEHLCARVRDEPELEARDVGYSLFTGRSAFPNRAVAIGGGRVELLAGVEALSAGRPAPGVVQGELRPGGDRLAFLFTGQGAQRVGMGHELYQDSSVFKDALDEVCERLDGPLGHSLQEVMFTGTHDSSLDLGGGPSEGLLDQTMFTQAGLFALEVSLFRLLEHWGVRPAYLLGHSIGELAAAHVAGVFSLEDACKLVAARGALMGALPTGGAMVAVQSSEQEARELLAGYEQQVALAAVNSPSAVVISGDEEAVLELAEVWRQRGAKTKRLQVSHAFHSPRMDGMLERFARVADGLSFSEPRIPIVSNLTGEPLSAAQACDPGYWVKQVRETVRFADSVRWLSEHGVASFLELGPDGVLSAMSADCRERYTEDGTTTAVSLLRGNGMPESRSLLGALAAVWVHGADVDWSRAFEGSGARQVSLPTYAFRPERHWVSVSAIGAGDLSAAGMGAIDHPLLGATLALADGHGSLLTGRISLAAHPWLKQCGGAEMVSLSAAVLLELALRAAEELGCELVAELALKAPLPLGAGEPLQLQVSVGELDPDGVRQVEIRSRRQGGEDGLQAEEPWTLHAGGKLRASADRAGEVQLPEQQKADATFSGSWPPPGAEAVDLHANSTIDGALSEPEIAPDTVTAGLQALWRRGEETFAEIQLPRDPEEQTGPFGLHPLALIHALSAIDESNQGESRVPSAFGGVSLQCAGTMRLRVHISPLGEHEQSLVFTDEYGAPVASLGSLATRTLSAQELTSVSESHEHGESLLRVEWSEVPLSHQPIDGEWAVLGRGQAVEQARSGIGGSLAVHEHLSSLAESIAHGAPVPKVVLAPVAQDVLDAEDAESVHRELGALLGLLQEFLADERLAGSRLVVLTDRAAAIDEHDDVPGLASAATWGLVRSAQMESPGRLLLVDCDGQDVSWAALPGALALDESQIGLRRGVAWCPRLVRMAEPDDGLARVSFDPEGTVLITGGTGGLGLLVARHLVVEHGVRRLILGSRRGIAAEGAVELQRELSALGAQVEILACDVVDRDVLAGVIEAVPASHPLRGIVHVAGTIEDGVVDSLAPEQLDRVLAPKLDAALHLHELTKEVDLSAFVLFSSAAGTLGKAGSSNYAAANAALDALAERRRGQGLPALSIGWGLWAQASDISAGLREIDRLRMARAGVGALSSEEGLRLLDLACRADVAHAIAARLDSAALGAMVQADMLPPLLRELAHKSAPRVPRGRSGSLQRRLLRVSEGERERVALEAVREEVAAVLGHGSATRISPQLTFKELGFDSLTALELRNQLSLISGLRLPATLVFNHPTTESVAGYLSQRLARGSKPQSVSVNDELERLALAISAATLGESERDAVQTRLYALASEMGGQRRGAEGATVVEEIESASAEEIIELIDTQLGAS